jgi:tRNA threonylcarbamoyl adenosine modification protein (Sua5/YciO/YrdC/YwlC family)
MVRIFNKDEVEVEKAHVLRCLKTKLFIYPTDTIYGIGCNALDEELVHQVRDVKKRHSMPFSVIAPNKEWIREHCEVGDEAETWLEKLPGPYTLIMRLKNPEEFPQAVNMGLDTLGVRIPDNWFAKIVHELNIPIITTSANLTGEDNMTSLDDLNPLIKKRVECIFYEGEITGRASTIVRLDTEKLEITER